MVMSKNWRGQISIMRLFPASLSGIYGNSLSFHPSNRPAIWFEPAWLSESNPSFNSHSPCLRGMWPGDRLYSVDETPDEFTSRVVILTCPVSCTVTRSKSFTSIQSSVVTVITAGQVRQIGRAHV